MEEKKKIKIVEANFYNIVSNEGRIEFDFSTNFNEGGEFSFYLQANRPINPSNEAIAAAFLSMCRQKFKIIYIDLEVEKYFVENIKGFTYNKAKITFKNIVENHISEKTTFQKDKYNNALNFSGGFDSLAVKYLLPEDTKLIAIKYGGRLERESDYFKKFEPYIIETNIRDNTDISKWGIFSPYDYNFFNLGSILFSEYLNLKYLFSGNVLEASASTINYNPKFIQNVGSLINLFHGNPSRLLTEVATTIILNHYNPKEILPSLESLAKKGERKYYRKQLLILLAKKRVGENLQDIDLAKPKSKTTFGTSFTEDFLAPYFIKHFGIEMSYLKDVPKEFIELSNSLNLSFYEKFNPNNLVEIPEHLRGYIFSKMAEAGVMPYDEKDWKEFRQIANFLNKYYPNIGHREAI